MKTRKLVLNALLAAMCAVLGYISLDFGNLKLTFETVPILVGAILFGPFDGAAIAGVGTLIYQLLRYGISATTVLWMIPYILCGFLVGYFAKNPKNISIKSRFIAMIVLNELLITILNTGVLYIDSHIYGYYSPAFIFGSLGARLVICVVKAIAFAVILPVLIQNIQKALHLKEAV